MATPRKQGLQWKKLDLHVHTPASSDYTGPSVSASELVAAALSKGVDGIAITDHNSADWIDVVQEAAKRTRLAVFPGVEITATGGKGGIHIIAIFDRTAKAKNIEALLAKLDIPVEMYGKQEAISPKSPVEVVELISDLGGLAVLAHADSSKGVLHDMAGQARVRVMNCAGLAAVEIINIAKNVSFLSGKDPDYQRQLPYYRASDSPNVLGGGHSIEGIGSRFSWFKVDGLSLEALRQCFNDPEVRIITDEASPAHPDLMYPRIVRASVSQGFLVGTPFEFHAGLNSVIGGKGVGKSLLVELLRFALDQPSQIPDLSKDMMGKLGAQVGIGGIVSVTVQLEKDSMITVNRTFDGRSNPTHVYYEHSKEAVPGNIAQIFPILAYSQTETLELAKNATAQLQLIDSFIESAALTRQIADLRSKLSRSDAIMGVALRAEEDLTLRASELATAEAKLARLDRALASKHHDELQKLTPKTQYLEGLQQHTAELKEVLSDAVDDLESFQVPLLPGELVDDSALEALRVQTADFAVDAAKNLAEIERNFEKVTSEVNAAAQQWNAVVSAKLDEYQQWAREQGGDRPQLLAQRQIAFGDREDALKAVAAAQATVHGMPELRKYRTELLDQLNIATDLLFELRQKKYEEISLASHGRLRLTVNRNGIRTRYKQELAALKKGSRMTDSAINAIADHTAPRSFVDYVLAEDVGGLAQTAGLGDTEVERLVRHLRGLDDLKELLCIQHDALVEDEPSIQFRKEDGQYYDLGALSVGQKCTALLIIALAQGDRPVVIDQPEDALDIPSVYNDVTLQLRSRKSARQFILTTHNPTVAVAADSDQFHVLRATATTAAFSAQGAIDRPQVRAEVLQHLEGGDIPFRLKTRKYNSASN